MANPYLDRSRPTGHSPMVLGEMRSQLQAIQDHSATAAQDRQSCLPAYETRHWVRVRKVERINAVNQRSGLPSIRIHTPEEVLDL